MYKYKRGINSIEQAKKIEYTLSDNVSTCLCMTGNLEFRRPYNGMYIHDGKILLLGMLEKILINDKEYNMSQITTSLHTICADEYISSIDLDNDTFEYNIGGASYKKTIYLYNKMLCIEYEINNKENSNARLKINPLLTYRRIDAMKTANYLKFNQRKDTDGVVVNLSIVEQENIVLKSKEFSWIQDVQILNNIKHECINKDLVKDMYTEDAFIPGEFELVVPAFETKKAYVYISNQEFDLNNTNQEAIFEYKKNRNLKAVLSIADVYVELKELISQIESVDFEDKIVSKLPYELDGSHLFNTNYFDNDSDTIKCIKDITDIIKSIDGQYISLDKLDKAKKILLIVRRYIKLVNDIKITNIDIIKQFYKLKLWYIESVNRLLQKENSFELFYDFVKEIIYSVIDYEDKRYILDDIETVSLMYNAIKIYENMLNTFGTEDLVVFNFREELKDLIENYFWMDDLRMMKNRLAEEEHIPCIEMIYTLSLSYPCIVGDRPIKLLDTIFKELYTPYGMREVPKNSKYSDGLIYPKYMAHFVKANLRQNGVTRASQKIAYNLVKELIQDINKHVNGGIKNVYSEKGIHIDGISYDLLTNAEMIRLYGMLT